MNRVKRLVHAEYAYKMGLTGKNVGVAILDTGIASHRDFDDRILAFYDFCNGKKINYDDNGHGTHVAGIVAGSGEMCLSKYGSRRYAGMAPQAKLVVLKILDENGAGSAKNAIRAIEWVMENRKKYNVRILNISVGMLANAKKKEQHTLLEMVDNAWKSGIVVVAAAGNNGPMENSITIPGISRKIVTVGSMDDRLAKVGRSEYKDGYSSVGPTSCCIIKPEILAPGTGVVSCDAGQNMYKKRTGTSMATPVVSGALALMCERYPFLKPWEIKLKLYERAYPRGDTMGRKSWGMLHVDNLIKDI